MEQEFLNTVPATAFHSETTVREADAPPLPDPVFVDFCPQESVVTMNGDVDGLVADVGEFSAKGLGRILKVNFTLKNISPDKRLAVMIAVAELDGDDTEHARGVRYFTIPARPSAAGRDIEVKCVKFVLPEDLSLNETAESLAGERRFRVSVLANYIDAAQPCCAY